MIRAELYSPVDTNRLESRLIRGLKTRGYSILEITDYSSYEVFKEGKFVPVKNGLDYHIKPLADTDNGITINMLFKLGYDEATRTVRYFDKLVDMIQIIDKNDSSSHKEKLAGMLDEILAELCIKNKITMHADNSK